MDIMISINCTECGRKTEVPIKRDDKGKYYLSDSIEEKQEGFYCSLDSQYSMLINCFCGHDIRLNY